MNTINNNQNTIDFYRSVAQFNSSSDTDSELKTKDDKNKKQYQDSIELSGEAVKNPFSNVLDNMVTAGTITEDQETAIQSALQAGRSMQSAGVYTSKRTDPLDSLVSAGTITSDQAAAIKNAFASVGEPGHNKQADPIQNALDDMVTAGTITSDEETAIESALKNALKKGKYNEENNLVDSTLDNLVSAGTITSDQETAIKTAFDSINQNLESGQEV